jgi:hypothetical protein
MKKNGTMMIRNKFEKYNGEQIMEENKIVMQLNRPALERLIGNDSEIEVKLRHQIIKQFLK